MEDLFNFQQRNHSMPDWREAYKILSVSGRPASRRAIDFSRAFWYRLLQDKVVWTCSTPITQAHRCRRYILLARMTKGAAVHENDKMEEHGREEMAEETKASGNVRRNQIFLPNFIIRYSYETVVHDLSWKLRVDRWKFSQKITFSFNHRKLWILFLEGIRINSFTFDIGNKQINSESKFWILESWLFQISCLYLHTFICRLSTKFVECVYLLVSQKRKCVSPYS